MSTTRIIQFRIWTVLFVILYLAAPLVPGSAFMTSTAAAQTDNCGDDSAAQADAAPQVVHAPDEEVTIPSQTVNRLVYDQLWQINADDDLTDAHVYILNTFMKYSNLGTNDDLYYQYRNEVTRQLNARDKLNGFIGKPSIDDVVNTMLNVALDIPALAPYAPRVWKKLNDYDSESIFANNNDRVAQSAHRYGLNDKVAELAEQSFIEIYDCAQTNPEVAKAVDRTYSKTLNVTVRDTAKTILAKNPDLPILKEIRDRIGEDGTLAISLNEIKELSKAEFAKINATVDDIQKTVKDIDERQKVIVDYLSNQAEKQAMQEKAKKDAEAYQLKLTAAQSGISILTTIAQQVDPKFAKKFSVVANSTLQVANSLNGWIKATAGLSSLSKLTSLSTVVMTGNVLGAVMNVVSLFSDPGPTPEQQIMDEIGKLREQVNELRTEMHERFDRIDQNLNTIYTTMNQRFDQIDIQLGRINGNIIEVQKSLAELDLKLSRIERNNFEFLNDLGRRPLLDAINGGLGYQARTGQPMPYQPDFVNFENVLHSWGTIHAFDSVNAGPAQRDYSDAQMLAELSAYPVDANINYINGWLMARGLPGISSKRLPSPRDWLFASRAYTQLALEWPEHMQRIDPKRQDALNQIGVELEAAMHNLSTLTGVSSTVTGTVTGTIGNQLLFNVVISNYQSKVDALEAAIGPVETAFMNEVRVNRLGRVEPFNLHGYIYQPLSFRSPEASVGTCGSPATLAYSLPAGFEQRIPNFELYNLAEYLNLGKLQTCVYDEWTNIVDECTNGECYKIADHKVVLRVIFGNRVLMTQTLPAPRVRIPESANWIRDNWTTPPYNYKLVYSAVKELDPMTPAQEAVRQESYTVTLKRVETELLNYQHELYGRIMNEMNQGSLKPLVNQVAGSKALLDTVVALGLPRAMSDDEFLHAMLYGNQQLVDDRLLVQDYAVKLAQPITQTRFTYNPRFMLGQVADQRREVFSGLVNTYLSAITAQTHGEAADYIANTRSAMALTMRVIEVEGEGNPMPNLAKRLYLPLVGR